MAGMGLNPVEIDSLILANVGERWTKVAMAIVRVAEANDPARLFEDEDHQYIASRIRSLVEMGQLESAGDLNEWRFSEVRVAISN